MTGGRKRGDCDSIRHASSACVADLLVHIVVQLPGSIRRRESPSAIGLSRHHGTGLQLRHGERRALAALPGPDSRRLPRCQYARNEQALDDDFEGRENFLSF